MAVTTDIVASHARPRRVMRRLLAMGERDDRALVILMVACFLMFAAQWPWRARQAFETGVPLTDLIQTDLFGIIFFFPLVAYGLAAISHLIAKAVRGRGSFYGARLALFWALLAASPAIVLTGLVKGFIGPGPAHTLVSGVWFALFVWIWLSSLWEAETHA